MSTAQGTGRHSGYPQRSRAPQPLPCRGAARTGPSPTGLLTMLVSCYRRGFRAPSCAQLLWKARKGTKGGDARSARWARPGPGTALPSPGNPAPAVPQAGPERKAPGSHPRTHGDAPGSPQPLLTGPRTDFSTAGPSRYSQPPHSRCSRGRAWVPSLPLQGRTWVSPSRQRTRVSPPAPQPGQSPPAAAHRGRRCLPGRDTETRSPSAAAPHRSNQQQDGGAREGGARPWPS